MASCGIPTSGCGGLLGLADRFKNLKGAPTDADVEELRKFFPERNEPEWHDLGILSVTVIQ